MKYIVFVLTLQLLLSKISAQSATDCAHLKSGTFRYENDSAQTVIIKRSAKKQEELNTKTGEKTLLKIKWLDNCSYELKPIWTQKNGRKKFGGRVSSLVITETSQNSYKYICTCKYGDPKAQTGITYKISDAVQLN